MRLLAVLICLLTGFAWAESPPGTTVLEELPWGTLFVDSTAERSSYSPGRHRIKTPVGDVRAVVTDGDVVVQYPNRDLRVRHRVDGDSGELLVQFQSKNYRFKRKGKYELSWHLPGEEIFFRYRGPRIYDALGDASLLKVRRRKEKGLYWVTSDRGQSEVQVQGSGLTLVEGEAPASHPYLMRGMVFRQGPVGIFVRLPGGELFEALDWTSARSVVAQMPPPKEKPIEEPEVDPLKANKPEWHSPVMKSNDAEKGTLKAREGKDEGQLDAKTAPNSNEILKVKGYDD